VISSYEGMKNDREAKDRHQSEREKQEGHRCKSNKQCCKRHGRKRQERKKDSNCDEKREKGPISGKNRWQGGGGNGKVIEGKSPGRLSILLKLWLPDFEKTGIDT